MSEKEVKFDVDGFLLAVILLAIIIVIGTLLHSIDKEDAHIRQELSEIHCRLKNIDAHIAATEARIEERERLLEQLKH